MYITITFSHDKKRREHVHKYLVHGENVAQASEAITQLLLDVYAKHGAGVSITSQPDAKSAIVPLPPSGGAVAE